MSNALLDYLNKRLGEKEPVSKIIKTPGPLITISRQVGCEGVKLATLLTESLNRHTLEPHWRVLSKEIFYESAKELNMDPAQVRRIFKFDSNILSEIINAFGTKKFISEKKIIRTVHEVIHSFAEEGYCIIVGRAAHIIAHDIKNALHIRLTAPIEYRINTIMKNNGLNKQESLEFINRVEKEREFFRKSIKKESLERECFDLCINRASFQEQEILELIKFALKKKNTFTDLVQSIQYY